MLHLAPWILTGTAALTMLPTAGRAHGDDELARRFSGYDRDGDGRVELVKVEPLPLASERATGELALLLIEARLLAGNEAAPLRAQLEVLCADWASEGLRPRAYAIELAPSEGHRDGSYVLALRELLRAARSADASLRGALLLGHFPDALLVRTCAWRRDDPLVLGSGEQRRELGAVPWLRVVPEIVAERCDLVLADLDGAWESLYFEAPTRLATLAAAFPGGVPERGGRAADAERGSLVCRDFFHVNDGAFDAVELLGDDGAVRALHVRTLDVARDAECSAPDAAAPNPLALPDLAISRLDARGNARDLAAERALLVEALQANHAYRTQPRGDGHHPASFACDLGSGFDSLVGAAAEWSPYDRSLLDLNGQPSRAALRTWLAQPASLRTLRAHSDPWGCAVGPGEEGTRVDAKFWRELRAKEIAVAPALWVHTGCQALSPPGAAEHPFDHPDYGRHQGAEAILFHGGAVAILGRAKVFYDEPRGFADCMRSGGRMGDAWRRYFELERAGPTWDAVGGDIGRKRTYFWSVLGDWSLRLPRS
ncbi:MAG: hypothetical protein IPN34_23660 [Planctomycetes bacterium]|nr:hypothetical protein [Planctomycetota bacterium]